jgi:hypothetical protein
MPHIVRDTAIDRALISTPTRLRCNAIVIIAGIAASLLSASASAQSAPSSNPAGVPVASGAAPSGGLATTPDNGSGNAFGGALGGSFFNPDTTPTDAPLTAITVQGQISVVFQTDGKLGMARSNFENSAVGPNATQEAVVQLMQQAAADGLGKAAEQGAQTGRADVIATVYRFAGNSQTQTIEAWQPLGTFINSTDMTQGADGKTALHAHIQFIPENPAK